MAGTSYFLGIDGGGTGCRAALVDREGRELARASGGAANVATDMDGATQNILNLIGKVFQKAQLNPQQHIETAAVLGLAGANVTKSNDPVRDALPCGEVYVTDDREIVVEGALGTSDGGLAAPGTGSFFACRKAGQVRSLGGWGFMLGDETSGAWLGRRLLSLAIHCHDGIETHSDLTRAILTKYSDKPSEMTQFANSASPGDFGSFAPQIVAAAEAGDRHGRALMQSGANWIHSALETLQFEPGMRLCLWGGLGRSYLPYLGRDFTKGYGEPESDAPLGAASIARRMFHAD